MCLGPLPPRLIDENGTEWLTFTNSGPRKPVHFDFEFLCNNSCSVFVKGAGWTKRSVLGSDGATQSDCCLSALWFDDSVNALQVLSYNALWVLWVFRVLLLKLILAKKMKIQSSWQTWSRWTKISISWAPVIMYIYYRGTNLWAICKSWGENGRTIPDSGIFWWKWWHSIRNILVSH